MAEQRYKGVLAVISDDRTVKEVAGDWGVSRQTLHAWLARYEAAGLEGLGNRSFRPLHCPHQMPVEIEIAVLEMRRSKPYWGARRLMLELARKRHPASALRVGGISQLGQGWGHRPQAPAAAPGALQTLGAGHPDGPLAAGGGGRLPPRRRFDRQGADRNRRPLEVLRVSPTDAPRTHEQGVRGLQVGAAQARDAGPGAHGQRQGLHRTALPAAGGGSL